MEQRHAEQIQQFLADQLDATGYIFRGDQLVGIIENTSESYRASTLADELLAKEEYPQTEDDDLSPYYRLVEHLEKHGYQVINAT